MTTQRQLQPFQCRRRCNCCNHFSDESTVSAATNSPPASGFGVTNKQHQRPWQCCMFQMYAASSQAPTSERSIFFCFNVSDGGACDITSSFHLRLYSSNDINLD
jgi:hypothetical protein